MRVNKRRLLEYLSSDLDIRWGRQVAAVRPHANNQFVTLTFKGESADGEIEEAYSGIVGADGPHSAGKVAPAHVLLRTIS